MVNKNGLACSSAPRLSVPTDSDQVTVAALPHSDSTPAAVAITQGHAEHAALSFLVVLSCVRYAGGSLSPFELNSSFHSLHWDSNSHPDSNRFPFSACPFSALYWCILASDILT